jgi:serine/threonine protein kinase
MPWWYNHSVSDDDIDGLLVILLLLLQPQARYKPALAKRIYPLNLALDAAQGMAHLHSLGFLHRDLKSANLFCKGTFESGLTVKVGDLGLSHRLKQVSRRASVAMMLGCILRFCMRVRGLGDIDGAPAQGVKSANLICEHG